MKRLSGFPFSQACSILLLVFLGGTLSVLAAQDKPLVWQIDGEVRGRYESLDGQFRSNRSENDQGLFFRTLLHIKAVGDNWAAGVELQDSRSYLTDSGSAISSSYINPVDVLQAYLQLRVTGFLGGDYNGSLKLGRQTISIGSKRQIERVSYANVIKNYTGVYLSLKNDRADEWHAFLASPLEGLPDDRDELLDNRVELDQEEFNRLIGGVHFRKANAFPKVLPNLWGELFVYGLYERDAFGNESPNRRYLTPGFRLYRSAKPGQVNFDIEGALRFGTRRASGDPADTTDLNVIASMLLLRVGYTFDHPWKPSLAAQYYWASGDKAPNDGDFDQYERLFGSRRTDLNNTSLHGPLTPANLSAPGVRFEMVPTDQTTVRVTYSAAFLAAKTDSFIIGRQRDPLGKSGSFLGHVFDSRFTYQFLRRCELELGASLFLHGEFTRENPQAPVSDQTVFSYAQFSFRF